MSDPLKISPRILGAVELPSYCPRCFYYKLNVKKMPFEFPMPGIMFYLDKATKDYTEKYLSKYKKAPKSFGPFSKATASVKFPFRMSHPWDSELILTAQPDFMLQHPDETISLIDFKTSKKDGGGKEFLPQYEIQIIGYSWVAQQESIGDFTNPGIIYLDANKDEFCENPLSYADQDAFRFPFSFKAHEVTLDFKRLEKCVAETKKIWKLSTPPRGVDNCKNCVLLTRLLEFDMALRRNDQRMSRNPLFQQAAIASEYNRTLNRANVENKKLDFTEALGWPMSLPTWADWSDSTQYPSAAEANFAVKR